MNFLIKYKVYLLILVLVLVAFLLRKNFSAPDDSPVGTSRQTKDVQEQLQLSDEEAGILKVSEIPPLFPGCHELATLEEKKSCSDEKLLQYLYAHIKYPDYAQQNGIEGRCVITFVVELDGTVREAKIIKDIGGGCGEASVQVVQSMNDMPTRWTPGMDKGKPARVRFNLPVSFRLEEKKETK